jgi:hypothetical protein
MRRGFRGLALILALALAGPALGGPDLYPWQGGRRAARQLADRIRVPAGYTRVQTAEGTFEHWLQHLPLKPDGASVHLYDGRLKGRQDVHAAVIDIDVGSRDLQQCADAVIRLRSEYLYSRKDYASIHFRFTSGDEAAFEKWSRGYRAKVSGNRVGWVRTGQAGTSYPLFRGYLDTVFSYAGTLSLAKELTPIDVSSLRIGDVFIQGGSPGHAVLVVDMAIDAKTGARLFLLAQSYMPAQEIHILKNPDDSALSPWYSTEFGLELRTPEWTFRRTDLRRF